MGRIDSQVLVNLLEEWHSDREERNKVLIFSTSVRLLKMIRKFIEVNRECVPVIRLNPSAWIYTWALLRRAGPRRPHRNGRQIPRPRTGPLHHARQHPGWRRWLESYSCEVPAKFRPTDAKANKVVIFDPSWSRWPSQYKKKSLTADPANDMQAMDRAFRIGQKRPV